MSFVLCRGLVSLALCRRGLSIVARAVRAVALHVSLALCRGLVSVALCHGLVSIALALRRGLVFGARSVPRPRVALA
jgi:hypothetical protein